MRSRVFDLTVLIALPIALLATAGCHRKKVTTAPDATPPAVAEASPTSPGASTPEAPPAPDAEADPLSGDLASVNEYLRQQGLLTDVYFNYDQADLSEQGRNQLARGAQFLRQHPQFLLTVEGHCDDRGTPEYNLALGERRASTVRDYLTSLGTDGARLSTISYGEERPVCSDSAESCWSQNRRAHPVVTGRSNG